MEKKKSIPDDAYVKVLKEALQSRVDARSIDYVLANMAFSDIRRCKAEDIEDAKVLVHCKY